MARKKSEGPREPKLLRVGVAAHELGLHPFTVRRWIKQRKIQAVRVGLEARIPRTEIERLVGKADERLLVTVWPGEWTWAKGRFGDATATAANLGTS